MVFSSSSTNFAAASRPARRDWPGSGDRAKTTADRGGGGLGEAEGGVGQFEDYASVTPPKTAKAAERDDPSAREDFAAADALRLGTQP
jgi:hypothetical protein